MKIGYHRSIDQEIDALFTIRYLSKPLINFMHFPLSQTFEGGTSDISDAIEKTTTFSPKGAFSI